MSKKTTTITASIVLSVFVISSLGQFAFAQYLPPASGQTGLDNLMDIAQERVRISQENPGTGSGTPIFAADGILGATALSACVFGGVAAAFLVKSRKGKYAAIGRG